MTALSFCRIRPPSNNSMKPSPTFSSSISTHFLYHFNPPPPPGPCQQHPPASRPPHFSQQLGASEGPFPACQCAVQCTFSRPAHTAERALSLSRIDCNDQHAKASKQASKEAKANSQRLDRRHRLRGALARTAAGPGPSQPIRRLLSCPRCSTRSKSVRYAQQEAATAAIAGLVRAVSRLTKFKSCGLGSTIHAPKQAVSRHRRRVDWIRFCFAESTRQRVMKRHASLLALALLVP
ncbi:hypothetical protein BD289DRAFT_396960 [Coniella lustricola]|uniref:Uncharacterized protein n=1 Tax=Coniella lustricola TaxID=2025994 RepID=A0A2T2ZWM0_9PEZI|nr:hypothetical protein BD289DRAFT_396960 [Coniella lustricola]